MKNEKWLGLAAIASAGIASLCCIGPTIFIALGLGGLGAFTVFETYRPVFMGITALVLAAAFYVTYRKREVACEDGSCRMASGSPKAKAALWALTAVTLVFMSAPHWLAALNPVQEVDAGQFVPGTYQTVALDVEGMTCAGCAAHIQKSLSAVPGVLGAEVDYESKQARVYCTKDAVSSETLLKAIRDAGYNASLAEEVL